MRASLFLTFYHTVKFVIYIHCRVIIFFLMHSYEIEIVSKTICTLFDAIWKRSYSTESSEQASENFTSALNFRESTAFSLIELFGRARTTQRIRYFYLLFSCYLFVLRESMFRVFFFFFGFCIRHSTAQPQLVMDLSERWATENQVEEYWKMCERERELLTENGEWRMAK